MSAAESRLRAAEVELQIAAMSWARSCEHVRRMAGDARLEAAAKAVDEAQRAILAWPPQASP